MHQKFRGTGTYTNEIYKYDVPRPTTTGLTRIYGICFLLTSNHDVQSKVIK